MLEAMRHVVGWASDNITTDLCKRTKHLKINSVTEIWCVLN